MCVVGSQDCGFISLTDYTMVKSYFRLPLMGSFTYPGFSHGSVGYRQLLFFTGKWSRTSLIELAQVERCGWTVITSRLVWESFCHVNTHYSKYNTSNKTQ